MNTFSRSLSETGGSVLLRTVKLQVNALRCLLVPVHIFEDFEND